MMEILLEKVMTMLNIYGHLRGFLGAKETVEK